MLSLHNARCGRPASAPVSRRTIVIRAAAADGGKAPKAQKKEQCGKGALVESVAGIVGLPKTTVNATVDALLDVIQVEVSRGKRVTLQGFGAFEARPRKARAGFNPSTGEKLQIKATTVPAFKPSPAFKDVVTGEAQPPSLAPKPVKAPAEPKEAKAAPAKSAAPPKASGSKPAAPPAAGKKTPPPRSSPPKK